MKLKIHIMVAALIFPCLANSSDQTLLSYKGSLFETVLSNGSKPGTYLNPHKALQDAAWIMGLDLDHLDIEPPKMVRVSRKKFSLHFPRYKSLLGEKANYVYIPEHSTIVVLEPPTIRGKADYANLLHEMTHHIQKKTVHFAGHGCDNHAEDEAKAVAANYLTLLIKPELPEKCRSSTGIRVAALQDPKIVF